jgi:hypothetical protein
MRDNYSETIEAESNVCLNFAKSNEFPLFLLRELFRLSALTGNLPMFNVTLAMPPAPTV